MIVGPPASYACSEGQSPSSTPKEVTHMRKLAVALIAVMATFVVSVTPSHAGWHGWGWRGPVFVGPRVVIGVPFRVVAPVYPRPFVYPPVVAVAPPVVVAPPVAVPPAVPPVYSGPAQPSWY